MIRGPHAARVHRAILALPFSMRYPTACRYLPLARSSLPPMTNARVCYPRRMRWLAPVIIAGWAVLAACSSEPKVPIDAAIDTVIDECPACSANQLCVAAYDGTCRHLGATCVAKTVDCPNNVCSTACQSAYCFAPLQCQNRAPCGGEPPNAFTCYGP